MQALTWSYTLPLAIDDQYNPITVETSCENQPKNLLITSLVSNVPTLTLNSAKNYFTDGETLLCRVDLSDKYNATNSYSLEIPVIC